MTGQSKDADVNSREYQASKSYSGPLLPIFPNHGPTKKSRQSRQMGEEEERELGDNKEKKTAVSIP